jgi:hypothetical protein
MTEEDMKKASPSAPAQQLSRSRSGSQTTSLFGGCATGGPSSISKRQGAAAVKLSTASHRAPLANVDNTHLVGMTRVIGKMPNSLAEMQTLLLVFTEKHRAPHDLYSSRLGRRRRSEFGPGRSFPRLQLSTGEQRGKKVWFTRTSLV